MKSKSIVTFLVMLEVLLSQACQSSTIDSSGTVAYPSVRLSSEAAPIVPDPHHHNGGINNNWLWKQNAADFEMLEMLALPGNVAQEAVNQKGSFSAFTNCDETCRIFVKDFTTDRTYELEAPSFLSSRPFSDLAWATEMILVFDQWTQPQHGVHYAVNVREEELVLASPFPGS